MAEDHEGVFFLIGEEWKLIRPHLEGCLRWLQYEFITTSMLDCVSAEPRVLGLLIYTLLKNFNIFFCVPPKVPVKLGINSYIFDIRQSKSECQNLSQLPYWDTRWGQLSRYFPVQISFHFPFLLRDSRFYSPAWEYQALGFPQRAVETTIQTLESVISGTQKKNKELFLTRFQIPWGVGNKR